MVKKNLIQMQSLHVGSIYLLQGLPCSWVQPEARGLLLSVDHNDSYHLRRIDTGVLIENPRGHLLQMPKAWAT